MKRFFFIALLALAACESPVGIALDPQIPLPEMPIIGDDTCHAAPHADLIGKPATALERVLILGQVRVIRPGMPVTADYRRERLNFDISEEQRIRRIWCG